MPVVRRAVAATSLVALVVLGAASAAGAHAVLLRTSPAAQSTLAESPSSIQLTYSEPVEVAFGAIRVFDVEGRRVDRGEIGRASGGREVSVAVPELDDGTYIVTWRVVSTDGHSVHGGFAFYVGAPSAISAVAVAADRGASSAIGWGFGVVRFVWFAALSALVGAVAARRWVWTPALRATGLTESDAAAEFRRRFRWALPAAWVALASSTVAALVFQAAAASGLSLASAARPTVLRELLHTNFGRVWLVEAALIAMSIVPVLALVARRRLLGLQPAVWLVALGALAAALCGVAPASGHARTASHPGVAVAATAVHLLAVTTWIGGLATVVILGGGAWRRLGESERRDVVRRIVAGFGRLGVVAVLALAVTGTVLAFVDLAAVSDLWRTTYGRLLSFKIVALVVALGLAARQRWVLPHRLDRPAVVRSFRRSAAVEAVALLAALGLASGLVAAVPGRSLALAARGPVSQERPLAGCTVQLFLDPSTVGDNQVHLTFVGAGGIAAAEVANADAVLGPAGGALDALALRLIAPGHFVADASLPEPGRYELRVTAVGGSTTFTLQLRRQS